MNSVLMKPGMSEVERQFLARAQLMFHTYPELLSFSLEEESGRFPDFPDPEEEAERFDLHVALATDVSDDFQQEMCRAVTEFLTEILHDHPETLEVLRGRTFARTLH